MPSTVTTFIALAAFATLATLPSPDRGESCRIPPRSPIGALPFAALERPAPLEGRLQQHLSGMTAYSMYEAQTQYPTAKTREC